MEEVFKQYNLEREQSKSGEDFYSNDKVTRTNKDLNVKDFYLFNDSERLNTRGERLNVKIVTEDNYRILPTDHIIGVVSTTAARTIYLPPMSIVGKGKHYIIFDAGGSAASNLITIDGNGSTINGDATKGISTNYKGFELFTDKSKWYNLNV